MESCKEFIARQIKDKEARMRAEIEEDRAFGRMLLQDAKKEQEREEREKDERKRKLLEQAEFLQEQMKCDPFIFLCLFLKSFKNFQIGGETKD